MPELTIMAYNIEHMNKMFQNNAIKPTEVGRAQNIAQVIKDINPHLLGISEAANGAEEHQHFVDNFLPGYKIAQGVSRGGQNLVFYYRDPFELVSIDEDISFYEPWQDDIDEDGLQELHKFERKPLEAVFSLGPGGPKLRVILVHTKSKGVFSVVDLHNFQNISMGNRKRLVAQAHKFRSRIDQLMAQPDPPPIIVMGDMNDGPGLDAFEKIIGVSFVETVMGSVFNPDGILHNSLWWMAQSSKTRDDLWTVSFPDPIVSHAQGYEHRVWIDHILLSQDMLRFDSPLRYVKNSGAIGSRSKTSRDASDHFPVYCKLDVD